LTRCFTPPIGAAHRDVRRALDFGKIHVVKLQEAAQVRKAWREADKYIDQHCTAPVVERFSKPAAGTAVCEKSPGKFLTLRARIAKFRPLSNSRRENRDCHPYCTFGAGGGTSIKLAIPDLALPEAPRGPFLLPEIPCRHFDFMGKIAAFPPNRMEQQHVEADDRR
jgi:hypothetical protein